MSEDVFIKQEADELTNRIVERLGERQQKLELMAEWERQGRKAAHLHPIFITLAAVACVGALFFFSPFVETEQSLVDELNITTPSLTDFRAATETTEIVSLLEQENYDKALEKTETALNRSNETIKMLEEAITSWGDDEAVRYDYELEWSINSELRWTYIYLLLKQGQKKDAKREIKRYLQHLEYCEHEAEARLLLERLKEK